MSDVIQSIQATQGPSAGGQLPQAALEQGALTIFNDGEAVFSGNGSTTATDVLSRLIEIGAEKDGELSTFVGFQPAGHFAAHQTLQHPSNGHLNIDPDDAVPIDQQLYVETPSLKNMLAPFKNNLAALQNFVSNAGSPSASTTTGAGVFSTGLNLPVSGEPEPMPGPGIDPTESV